MKLRLKKWRVVGQSALLCPWADSDPKTGKAKSHGMLHFQKIGEVHDISDPIGYQILSKHSDILEVVASSAKKK